MKVKNLARAAAAAVVLAAAVIMLTTCSDSILNEMQRMAADANRPEILPLDGTIITSHEVITLTFNRSMDDSTITISGDIGTAEQKPVTKSQTNDTLILNPYDPAKIEKPWNPGTGRTLIVSVSSSGQTATYTFTFEVFRGVCVGTGGDDTNTGTALSPKLTIAGGIAAVQSPALYASSGQVRVSGGEYAYNWADEPAKRILLQEGISLLGGYAPDWTERNISSRVTTISDTSINTDAMSGYNCAVKAVGAITTSTVLEGFTIRGGLGDYSAAVACDGSSPTIRNNTIISGGTVADAVRWGIFLDGSGTAKIIGNHINGPNEGGGNNILLSYGIDSRNASPDIDGNVIYGGSAASSNNTYESCALSISGGAPIVHNNSITGGYAWDSYGVSIDSTTSAIKVFNNLVIGGPNYQAGGGDCHCIRVVAGTPPLILNNTIVMGAQTAIPLAIHGIHLDGGFSASIENNIFLCTSSITAATTVYAIYENSATHPAYTNNNDFANFSATCYTYRDTGTATATVETLESYLEVTGNTPAPPGLNASYEPTSSTPPSIAAGGLDGVEEDWGFSTDRNGKLRTGDLTGTGWTMGCYEW